MFVAQSATNISKRYFTCKILFMKAFNSVCLISPDVAGLRAFYARVLGTEARGDETFSYFETRGAGLSIYAAEQMTTMAPEYALLAPKGESSLEFEVEDVDREYARLLELGVPVLKPPTTQPWGIRSLWFRDPAGNIVNFLAPVGQELKKPAEAARLYFERLINQKDLAACDELLAADYCDHDAPEDAPPGPAGVKEYAAGLFRLVPDLRVEILDLLADGLRVAARLRWTGTRADSGEPYRLSGLVLLRVNEVGRLAERWSAYES